MAATAAIANVNLSGSALHVPMRVSKAQLPTGMKCSAGHHLFTRCGEWPMPRRSCSQLGPARISRLSLVRQSGAQARPGAYSPRGGSNCPVFEPQLESRLAYNISRMM